MSLNSAKSHLHLQKMLHTYNFNTYKSKQACCRVQPLCVLEAKSRKAVRSSFAHTLSVADELECTTQHLRRHQKPLSSQQVETGDQTLTLELIEGFFKFFSPSAVCRLHMHSIFTLFNIFMSPSLFSLRLSLGKPVNGNRNCIPMHFPPAPNTELNTLISQAATGCSPGQLAQAAAAPEVPSHFNHSEIPLLKMYCTAGH